MGEGKVTIIKDKGIFAELLTLVSLFFMITVQFGDINGKVINHIIKLLMFINFLYHVGSCIWRIFTSIQERMSFLNGMFNVRNIVELVTMCILTLYFKEVVTTFDPDKRRMDRCVIVLSMGYLLSKVNEVLDYSTTQSYWSKMIFSTVIILIIGVAAVTDFSDGGVEGPYSEIAYVVGVILAICELAVEGRVVKKSVFKHRRFSVFMAFLLICAISFPAMYPIVNKWKNLFVKWLTERIVIWIKPRMIKVKDKILAVTKEQIRAFISDYTRKVMQEYIPNLKNAIKNRVAPYIPENVKSIPGSIYEWWKRLSGPQQNQPPIGEFD
ncbi:hypothetical protein EROM_061020 [Encephalitozoon romaleae SJ-2008]|uniref:Uncharacterized protein n=1 Tax=Encephalitozoon romaleae (strain SJ-2008) TaxID=1178016 RepID=I7AN82_ENCRO|nr:hypothetical protein EROM_061020 [Encephalitozoon romaleae SJ-2008]AFN83194.1 hypothetical protein EROM_061020 [Encephalitozoon romaleae SJ-2008]